MVNAVYKLLTDQARISPDLVPEASSDFCPESSPNKWPWRKRNTWASLRERYKITNTAPFPTSRTGTQVRAVPRTPPQALPQQLTLTNRKGDYHPCPSAFGNEQSQRSSKARLVGTNKMATFVLLNSVPTCHQNQNSNSSSRVVQPRSLLSWE